MNSVSTLIYISEFISLSLTICINNMPLNFVMMHILGDILQCLITSVMVQTLRYILIEFTYKRRLK